MHDRRSIHNKRKSRLLVGTDLHSSLPARLHAIFTALFGSVRLSVAVSGTHTRLTMKDFCQCRIRSNSLHSKMCHMKYQPKLETSNILINQSYQGAIVDPRRKIVHFFFSVDINNFVFCFIIPISCTSFPPASALSIVREENLRQLRTYVN